MNGFVYIVIPEGVSAQSPPAVCATRHEATKIAEDLWRDSDGYHTFRVECRRLGKVYDTFLKGLYGHRMPTTRPPVIEQVNERDVDGYR